MNTDQGNRPKMSTDEHGSGEPTDRAAGSRREPTAEDQQRPADSRQPTADSLLPRRAFLRRVGGLGLSLAGVGAAGALFHQAEADEAVPAAEGTARVFDTRVAARAGAPVLATVKGGDRAEAVKRAIDALGGIGRFVQAGESVLVKPNIGWDRLPMHGANTNPEVVAAIVRLCKEAGAGKVVVTDMSCNDPRRCFERSGIWKAAEDAGAEVVLPTDGLFEAADLGGGLGSWQVLKPLFEAQRVINVPVVKHHGTSRLTAGMKNWYGVLSAERRANLHRRMDEAIAALAAAVRPSLTVVDATRVLLRNGPQGGGLSDVEERNLLAASTDPVAADAWAAEVLGKAVADIGYIGLAERAGLGTATLQPENKQEIEL